MPPQMWESDLAAFLHVRGYDAGRIREVLAHAELYGSLWCLEREWFADADRCSAEQYLPDRVSDWSDVQYDFMVGLGEGADC